MTDKTLTDELAAVIAEVLDSRTKRSPASQVVIDLVAQAIAERLEQVGWWDENNDDREEALHSYYPGSPYNQDLADKMGWKPAFTVRLHD